jgi:peptidoglycan/xylan/chitin deacetylase (PgdA/CDA1 family)
MTPPPPGVIRGGGPGGAIMTTGSQAVALTFDDGPFPEYTPQILDLLRFHDVKATFCVVGKQVHSYPDQIRRIYLEGHTYCNHTWRHDLNLAKRGEAAIRDDLSATNRAIREIAPGAKIGYFRAPGGNFDAAMVEIAASMGMTSLYWQVDTRDWEYDRYPHGQVMADNVIVQVKENTRPGSIILAHDKFKLDTVIAFETVLPWLKQRYTLIALPPDGKLPRP